MRTMIDVRQLLRGIPVGRRQHWEVEDRRIRVSLGSTGRRQDVRFREQGDDVIFSSTVLSSKQVPRGRRLRAALVVAVWERNATVQLVGFGFDKKGRLVGQVRHPAEHLDPAELELYVNALAVECDRLEYLLTGRDRS